MEVYLLDGLNRRQLVVDRFESLIWTERFAAAGDFQLMLHSTLENRSIFAKGTRLAISDSYRVMVAETTENIFSSDGKATLKVSGRSLETILDDRVARVTFDGTETSPKWVLTGTPGAIARQIYHDICGTIPVLMSEDALTDVIEGSIFPTDTLSEPTDVVTIEIEPMSVYRAIKELVCDVYDLGFRLVRHPVSCQLYFDVYVGSDRTTSQDDLSPVIFSPELDNLSNTKELSTSALYKNCAYVFSPVGSEVVYPLDVDPTITGFERRVLVVVASDITDTDPAVASAKMIQRGNQELAKCRVFSAFDGELNQINSYRYGLDYNLGDLVEMRASDGVTNSMRVTEQIFVSDAEGDRSYPTLSINQFIMPGTWLAWDYNKVWADYDAEATAWGDL